MSNERIWSHINKRGALFYGVLLSAVLFLPYLAQATSITSGPSLSNTAITSESNGATSGTTVQFSLDTGGQVEVDFFLVSPADSSLTQVTSIVKTFPGGGPQTIPWNGLWLIGTDNGRHNGTFTYQVIPSSAGTVGTTLPTAGDPGSLFTINSVDIHNLTFTSSLDSTGEPTFPCRITYALSKTSTVSATITNSSGTVVRTLLTAQRQAGEATSTSTLTWDGLGSDGKLVSIGTYKVNLTATDPLTGDIANPHSSAPLDILSLAGGAQDPQKLFEDNVFVYPNPVRNGQGTFQIQSIRDGANISLKIYTITGTLVFEQTFPGVSAGNLVTFPWTATNQSGKKVGRGLYYYVVREDDATGTLQTVKKMAVLP